MEFSNTQNNNLIAQFVDEKVLQAFNVLSSDDSSIPDVEIATTVAQIFCAGNSVDTFSSVVASADNTAELKLVNSFHNNLKLLVEKTWVEPSDATVKEQVLYRIDKLCPKLENGEYGSCYSDFISVLTDVVYLMFGSQAKKEDFPEYALRIDPEFGIFWWYVQSLPAKPTWQNEKSRVVILLGMYFLANY